jgi:hypothetical protein
MVDDNTAPVITGTIAPVTIEGCTTADAPAALTTVAALETAGLTITDACTADMLLLYQAVKLLPVLVHW